MGFFNSPEGKCIISCGSEEWPYLTRSSSHCLYLSFYCGSDSLRRFSAHVKHSCGAKFGVIILFMFSLNHSVTNYCISIEMSDYP
jgi:hypothetical protein